VEPTAERRHEEERAEQLRMDQLERQKQQYEMKQRKQLGLSAPQGGALQNKEFDRFYSTFIQVFKSIEH